MDNIVENGAAEKPVVAAQVAGTAPAQQSTSLTPGDAKVVYFDPAFSKVIEDVRSDPMYIAIHNKWSDRQQHGRLAYDSMMHHSAVSTPFNFLVATIKSFRPIFKPSRPDATEKQVMLADFANAQLARLGASGDPLQGYEHVIDWFGQGWLYGFSLAEMETSYEMWRGSPRIQLDRVVPLPQATLDLGYVPREEFGEAMLDFADKRYRCFKMNMRGRVESISQFWRTPVGNDERQVTWTGGEMSRLLHHVHNGREGNVFGESMLFTAFYHWADLYTLELIENAMLDAAVPFLGISYKTQDGVPRPEVHAMILDAIRNQDPSTRLLVLPDTDFTSVALSNKEFTEQAKVKKKELRAYITQSMLVPAAMYKETDDSQSDARNLQMVFLKRVVPSYLAEVSNVLRWQLAKRLIDANWSKLTIEDYPVLTFNVMVSDDLQAALPMLTQLMKYVDSSRLGEFASAVMPYFEPDWIPKDHADSVFEMRPTPTETAAVDANGNNVANVAQATGRGADGGGGKVPGTDEQSKVKKAA